MLPKRIHMWIEVEIVVRGAIGSPGAKHRAIVSQARRQAKKSASLVRQHEDADAPSNELGTYDTRSSKLDHLSSLNGKAMKSSTHSPKE